MKKPKIIFLGPIPPPFMGPSVATEVLLNSKLKDDFEILHLDTSDRRDLSKLGAIDFQNIFLALKHYIILVLLILNNRPAMVYIPISQTTIGYLRDAGFILISKVFHRKTVCHLRGGNFKNWYDQAPFVMKWFVKTIHSFVDVQIVLGQSLRHLFSHLIDEQKIFVVPNGGNYSIEKYRRDDKKIIRILYLANFIRTKGLLDALFSIPEVYNEFKDIEVVFAGSWRDDKTRLEFETFIEKNPKLPVIMKGPVYGEEKNKLLASADIFVFPTYYPPEGHPWVIVEAMAAGLPIISTDQGAIKESVIDGVNGYIVEKQDSVQIARKLKIIVKDSNLRQAMGAASKTFYKERFTEDKMVESMSQAFYAVLNDKTSCL